MFFIIIIIIIQIEGSVHVSGDLFGASTSLQVDMNMVKEEVKSGKRLVQILKLSQLEQTKYRSLLV